jgi:YbgC/YbaW family acyl-CoA thioester hydrolase
MPVAEINIKYKRPAEYYDLLTIRSQVEVITDDRVVFRQDVYSESDKLLTEGRVKLASIDSRTIRPIHCYYEITSRKIMTRCPAIQVVWS